jgi:hypothetical protein
MMATSGGKDIIIYPPILIGFYTMSEMVYVTFFSLTVYEVEVILTLLGFISAGVAAIPSIIPIATSDPGLLS